MAWSVDARVPVTLVADMAALAAALAEGVSTAVLAEAPPPPTLPEGAVALASFEPWQPAHALGCACCGGRPPAAAALDRLFLARVKGGCGWFRRVVALVESEPARAALAAALAEDALTAARFRAA